MNSINLWDSRNGNLQPLKNFLSKSATEKLNLLLKNFITPNVDSLDVVVNADDNFVICLKKEYERLVELASCYESLID